MNMRMYTEDSFRGEVRDGFYIRPMIKRAWAAQLKVLQEIDSVCKRHSLMWFMDFGTLLGACREQGYIAWDDDIDIGMLRGDFELFKKYAREELPEGFFWTAKCNEESNEQFFGVRNSDHVRMDEKFLEQFYGCPYAVGVDIFVYDAVPDDTKEREIFMVLLSSAVNSAEAISAAGCYEACSEEVHGWISGLEDSLQISLKKDEALKAELYSLSDRIGAMYFDVKTENMAISRCLIQDRRYLIKREWVERTTYLPFEGEALPVPIGYKELLSAYYGEDYMIPQRDGAGHDYPYFKDQEERLLQWFAANNIKVPDIFKE